jgi:magnesium chelatase family protein
VSEAIGRACTVAMVGLDAHAVTVEAHVGAGLPGFHIIGSSGAAAREAADRVRTALGAVGVTLPARKTLLSLAPADVPKAGGASTWRWRRRCWRNSAVCRGPHSTGPR